MRDRRIRPTGGSTAERAVDVGNTVGTSAARVPDLLSPLEWSQLIAALRLSPRQAEVLRHALYDSRDSRIAERMRLPISTVHSHRGRLFRKLAVGSMAEALSLVGFPNVINSSLLYRGNLQYTRHKRSAECLVEEPVFDDEY
jgi:DNA-binding CsgD family transcriptional regulator